MKHCCWPQALDTLDCSRFILKIESARCLKSRIPFFQCCGLGLRTVDAFSNAPKHLDIAGTDEPNARLLTIQRKLNTNFSLVGNFLTRKFRELFITSKTLQPNERYFSLSRLRLLKHQTRSPATCLVATQLQDVYENKVVYFQKIHTSTQIPNFVAS